MDVSRDFTGVLSHSMVRLRVRSDNANPGLEINSTKCWLFY